MIQENAFDSELSRRLRQAWPEIPAETFIRLKDIRFDKARMTGDMGKRDLYVVEEAFDIVKPCPCTAGALPCGYVILNLGFGCPYDCSYCYLQHYSNFPGILLPANLDVFFEQAAGLLESKGRIRVGTGEFCDSLALDPWTGYAGRLLEFVRDKDILFEFKTKSANVDALLAVPASPNVVAGWSLNPPELAESEELYAATVEERLEAASRAVRHGYHVAFHFDPIIPYAGWEQAYTDLVARMFSVARGRIAWISLGCLRFYRGLKLVAEQRFPEDPHLYGEFLLDPIDNKMRYPSHLREKVFKHMLELIRSADPAVPVYLCMEDERMWARVFGHDLTPIQVEADLTRPLR
jgi:spore photoproduct lyase